MSTILQVSQAKPNPLGKDKTSGGVPKPEQLIGEWVDIKNIGTEPMKFSSMALHHTLFTQRCENTGKTEQYWTGSGEDALKPGEVLRVYTGKKQYEHLMTSEDRGTVKWRVFAGKDNFVLNNRCGDTLYVTWRDASSKSQQDSASYDREQREGAILIRVGDKLLDLARR
jgi:hypothetical protein